MAMNVSHKPNWIVDTGATNHMASSLELLNKLSVNKLGYNRTVELPNGDETKVTHTGLSSISDVTGDSLRIVKETKEKLKQVFKMKDLGELRYFLGIEFARSDQGILMHQRKYTLELISETRLNSSKPAATPMDTNVKLTTKQLDEYIRLRNLGKFNSNDQLADQGAYQRLIGKLLYLTVTRPDIAFGVNTLSQFLQQSKKSHMEAALRIVRYVKNQPGLGVLLSSNKNTTLTAYCDSDWASCPHTRRSVTGYLVKFGDSLLTWKSKKQTTISKSSAEAEYRSMAAIVSELIWIIGLMKELGKGILIEERKIQGAIKRQTTHPSGNPVLLSQVMMHVLVAQASSFLRWVVPRRSNKTASLWKQGEQGTETCQKDGLSTHEIFKKKGYPKDESVKEQSDDDETKSEENGIEQMRNGGGTIVRPNRVHYTENQKPQFRNINQNSGTAKSTKKGVGLPEGKGGEAGARENQN
uniref:Reverse transcriptase Ty1/copia-type domain-containing protein n=1 Tax=Solanum lycopersicum TaxID=4081 RepID=A0A3Q7EU06_SOLLC